MRIASALLFFCLTMLVGAASRAWSQEEPDDNPFGPVSNSIQEEATGSEAEREIEQILESPLHEQGLEFVETPLSEVMKFIGEEYGFEIKIDEVAFKDLELSTDAPVTVQMRNISLRSALRLMLKEHDLTYLVDEGQLVITSEDEAFKRSDLFNFPFGPPIIYPPSTPCPLLFPDRDPTPSFEASAAHKQNTKIRRTLARPLLPGGIDITEMPLSDFATFIREQYKLEVQVDLPALDDLGLTPDDALTFRIDNVPLGVGLRETLRQFDLVYIVRDGFLLITSEDEALSIESIRIYPVGDLLQPVKANPQLPPTTIEQLIEVIAGAVAYDGCIYDGGGIGSIEPLQPGLLVISQTDQSHAQIAELLAALRRAREHEFAIPYAPQGHGKADRDKKP